MPLRTRTSVVYALLAVVAGLVFFAISIDSSIYAPGAGHLHRIVQHGAASGGLTTVNRHLAHDHFRRGEDHLTTGVLLRKAYSVVAFGIVGLFLAPLIRPDHRLRGDAVLVAGFSTCIELAQKATIAPFEQLHWELFDVGCGALGGWLGALAFNALARLRAARGRAAPRDRAPDRSERSATD